MDRIDNLAEIAICIENLVRRFGRRDDIAVTFCKLDKESIAEFNSWDRQRFSLIPGEECFFVWEKSRPNVPDHNRLLYVVCVTGDSILTAASEIMNLVCRKF